MENRKGIGVSLGKVCAILFLALMFTLVVSSSAEAVFWNSTFTHKTNVLNKSQVLDVGVSLNESFGFCGNPIWFKSMGPADSIQIYHNNTCSAPYSMSVNDTTAIPFMTEGGGSNSTLASIWNKGATIVYHFTGNGANAADSSGNNNNGAEAGNPTYESNGIVGNRINLDGTGDWVDTGIDLADSNYSLVIWSNTSTTGTEKAPFGAWQGSNTGMFFRTTTGNVWNLLVGDGSLVQGTGNINVADGAWHLTVVTHNAMNNSNNLYLDGNVSPEISFTKNFGTGAANLMVGARDSGGAQPWTGHLDVFKYYPYVLSADEIVAEYNNSLTGQNLLRVATQGSSLTLTNKHFGEFAFTNLTTSGSVSGRYAETWTSSQSKNKNVVPINTSQDAYFVMEYTTGCALTVRIGSLALSAPNVGGGTYHGYGALVGTNNLSATTTINITHASGSSCSIDYIGLLDGKSVTAGPYYNGTSVFGVLTNLTYESMDVDLVRGTVNNRSTDIKFNAVNISQGVVLNSNYFSWAITDQGKDINYSFNIEANHSTNHLFTSGISAYTVYVDGKNPVIESGQTITPTNVVLNHATYNVQINLTEPRDDYVELVCFDVCFTSKNLTKRTGGIWNTTLNVTSVADNVTFGLYAYDQFGHLTNNNFSVLLSNLTITQYEAPNLAWDRDNTFITVGSSLTAHDYVSKFIHRILAEGKAFVSQQFTQNLTINANISSPRNVTLYKHDGTSTGFGARNALGWYFANINNTANNAQTLYENVTVNVTNGIVVQFNQSGANRLFKIYSNVSATTLSLKNVSVSVPLQNALNGSVDSLTVEECTSGISGWSCDTWSDKTSALFSKTNSLYHYWCGDNASLTCNSSYYPTVDTVADGLKDVLRMSIPTLSERLWRISTNAGTAETDWDAAGGGGDPPPAGGGGGGGGSGATDTDTDSGKALCDIVIQPAGVVLTDESPIAKVTIENREDFSYVIQFGEFEAVPTFEDVGADLRITNQVLDLFAGETTTFGIEYRPSVFGGNPVDGRNVLVLENDKCKDVNIQIETKITKRSGLAKYFNEDTPFLESLLLLLLDPVIPFDDDIERTTDNILNAYVLIILFIVFLIMFNIMKGENRRPVKFSKSDGFDLVLKMISAFLLATASSVLLVGIVRTILGG